MDYDRNRHESVMPVVKLDLSKLEELSILVDLIDLGIVDVLTSAPPCGTASRARESPLNSKHAPVQLRSSDFPYGLPSLEGKDLHRVTQANLVYDNLFILIKSMLDKGKFVIIENPLRSYLWDLPTFKSLLDEGCFDVCLQNCKFSVGEDARAKWSRFRTNIPSLQALKGPCTLKHNHLPWGVKEDGSFATADEAAYPLQLCFQLAQAIVQHLNTNATNRFVLLHQPSVELLEQHKKRKLLSSQQPRGNKFPSLVPEYKEVVVLPDDCPIPPNGKLLRLNFQGGDNDAEQKTTKVVGLFRSPKEFVDEAMLIKHPIDRFESMNTHIFDTIVFHAENSAADIAKLRVRSIREIIKLVHDSQSDNNRIFQSMKPGMSRVLKGKQLAALCLILEKHKMVWNDSSIVSDLIQGASLTGMQPHSGTFQFQVSLPQISVNQLRAQSDVHNLAMMARTKPSSNVALDKELWDQTIEEKNLGWLDGPFYSISEACKHVDDKVHLTRRFAIQQSSKIRAIDDYAESNINLAFGHCDKLDLMDIDTISATIRMIEAVFFEDVSELVHPEGGSLVVHKHKDWLTCDSWQGATLDLKSAYKQIAVSPEQLWSSTITVYDPESNRPAIFVQNTLPFGSVASVILFNRIARFLWFVGCVDLKTIWHNFYDDFPTLTPTVLNGSTKSSLELFMKVLGWDIANDSKKSMSFNELFSALGVEFDVSDLKDMGAFVCNTQKRKKQLIVELQEVIANKHLPSKIAESLIGKLQFMESHCFGKIGRSYLRCIRNFIGVFRRFEDIDSEGVSTLVDWIENCEPRRVSPKAPGVTLLFTDGACEFLEKDKVVSCGAICFPEGSAKPLMFGVQIPDRVCKHWSSVGNKEQLVTEAELIPAVIALQLWKQFFEHRRAIIFVDSEPAKHCLIRGTSNVETCAGITHQFYKLVDSLKTFPWFSRVPTYSNPADPPSRLDFETPRELFGAEQVQPPQGWDSFF